MKKILAVIAVLGTLVILVGCSSTSSTKPEEKKTTETKTSETAKISDSTKSSDTATKSDRETRDQIWKAVETASAISKAADAKNIQDVKTKAKELDEIIDPVKKLIKDESLKPDLSAEKIADLAKEASPDFAKIKDQATNFSNAAKKAIVQFSTKEVAIPDLDKSIALAKDIKKAADSKDKAAFEAKVEDLDATIDPLKPAITAKDPKFNVSPLSAHTIENAVNKENNWEKAAKAAEDFVPAAEKAKELFK